MSAYRIVFLVFVSFLVWNAGLAQRSEHKKVITGTVKGSDRKPVCNAIILVDNLKTNSFTATDGSFRVKTGNNALRIGVFSIGHGVLEEDIAGRSVINLVFKTDSIHNVVEDLSKAEREAIIDANTSYSVGYNYVKRRDMVNNISILDPSKTKKTYSSVYQMIIETPGVNIINGQINIGMARNLFGFVGPVILVDGIERPLDGILPSQVESIAVLKDASAAIYGSRAFGGAIIIKLKKIEF